MLEKRRYYLIILTLLLFVSIDISSYNYIALGKEDDSEDNVKDEKEEKSDDRDSEDNVKDEKEEEKDEKEEEKDEVPFILPFNAVPFP